RGDVNLVPASGSTPTIVNAGGDGLALAQSNDVQGVDIGTTSGAGISGTGVNAATIGTDTPVTISGSGTNGFDLNGGSGTIDVAAPISGAAGNPVRIQNRTGGTTTL